MKKFLKNEANISFCPNESNYKSEIKNKINSFLEKEEDEIKIKLFSFQINVGKFNQKNINNKENIDENLNSNNIFNGFNIKTYKNKEEIYKNNLSKYILFEALISLGLSLPSLFFFFFKTQKSPKVKNN